MRPVLAQSRPLVQVRECRVLQEQSFAATHEHLTHDPDPKGRVSANCVAVFPRDKRQGICAEIMRKH
jgi:hypothetical protein